MLANFFAVLKKCMNEVIHSSDEGKHRLREYLLALCNKVVAIRRGCILIVPEFDDRQKLVRFFHQLFTGEVTKALMSKLWKSFMDCLMSS